MADATYLHTVIAKQAVAIHRLHDQIAHNEHRYNHNKKERLDLVAKMKGMKEERRRILRIVKAFLGENGSEVYNDILEEIKRGDGE